MIAMKIKRDIAVTVRSAVPKSDLSNLSEDDMQNLVRFFGLLYEWHLEDKAKKHED